MLLMTLRDLLHTYTKISEMYISWQLMFCFFMMKAQRTDGFSVLRLNRTYSISVIIRKPAGHLHHELGMLQ